MATITAFRTALDAPQKWFSRLAEARWNGEPVRRSTYFAEAEVALGTGRGLLFMPLSSLSLRRAERLIPKQLYRNNTVIPHLEIFRNEMRYMHSDNSSATCDILYEPLPDALPLADTINSFAGEQEASQIITAIKALREELHKADISHNNLREENLMIDNQGRILPIRWYYATSGAGGDDEALDALCTKIASLANNMLLCDAESAAYTTSNVVSSDYITVGRFSEGLIAIEQSSGWGFIDSDNNIVIEPKYLWVNDFHEGRAEVECAEGMGLIDKQGEYIIPPHYRIVEYDPVSGCSQVYDGHEWLEFDYSGHLQGEPTTAAEPTKEIEYYN